MVQAALCVGGENRDVSGDICHVVSERRGEKVLASLQKVRLQIAAVQNTPPAASRMSVPKWCLDSPAADTTEAEACDWEALPASDTPAFDAVFAGFEEKFARALRGDSGLVVFSQREIALLAQIIGEYARIPWSQAKVCLPEYMSAGHESGTASKYFVRLQTEGTG